MTSLAAIPWLEPVADVLIVLGAVLMLLAAVGLIRLPDLYSRMQAATKASALGVISFLLAGAMLLPGSWTAVKLLLAAVFQLMTAPVAAHVIARAAHRAGVPQWEESDVDELLEDRAP